MRHGWMCVQRSESVTADIADRVGMKSAQGALSSNRSRTGMMSKPRISPSKSARWRPIRRSKLVVLRQGEEKTTSVTLGELPNEREARASVEDHENAGEDATRLGLILAPAAKVMDSSCEGVVVTAIDPDGQAARLD